MFLRSTIHKKDGKVHRYWSIVENRRLPGGCVSQRHVLYLGEINSSEERAWRKSIEVFDERTERTRSLSLFPEDCIDEAFVDESVVQLCLSPLRLCRYCSRRRATLNLVRFLVVLNNEVIGTVNPRARLVDGLAESKTDD